MSGSPLSRRGLLVTASAVTALGVAACDLDPTSTQPTAQPTAQSSPDPDQAVVTAARAELVGLIVRLGTGRRNAALVAVHRVQLTALQGDPPSASLTGRPLTPAQVVVRERRAADRFTRWATTCENGDLARVLGSIAAGIRMQPVLRGSA